jgi:hypothetical protein
MSSFVVCLRLSGTAFEGVALAEADATTAVTVRIFILSCVTSIFASIAVLALSGYVGHSLGVFSSLSGWNEGPRVIVDIDCESPNDICAISATGHGENTTAEHQDGFRGGSSKLKEKQRGQGCLCY